MNLQKPLNNTQNPAEFTTKLLKWFKKYGRKTLPWQQNKTPYRVWVSEIMLQQTQVTTVIPYYERFIKRFPDIISLADAPEDEVLHLWTGLGYYSRARNLHKTARMIKENYRGTFPDTLEMIQQLPGIGRSTAGAILSIAFKKPIAILDGNVKRVLARFLGVDSPLNDKSTLEKLWSCAENFTSTTNPDHYAQAIMDLGATICVRSKPCCEKCPLQNDCFARQNNLANFLPIAKTKKVLPIKQTTLCFIYYDQHIFLEKRPAKGIWGGLWSPIQIESHINAKQIKNLLSTFKIKKINLQPILRHTFTHFHLEILPAIILIDKNHQLENEKQLWYNLVSPPAIGLPAPIEKIMRTLR